MYAGYQIEKNKNMDMIPVIFISMINSILITILVSRFCPGLSENIADENNAIANADIANIRNTCDGLDLSERYPHEPIERRADALSLLDINYFVEQYPQKFSAQIRNFFEDNYLDNAIRNYLLNHNELAIPFISYVYFIRIPLILLSLEYITLHPVNAPIPDYPGKYLSKFFPVVDERERYRIIYRERILLIHQNINEDFVNQIAWLINDVNLNLRNDINTLLETLQPQQNQDFPQELNNEPMQPVLNENNENEEKLNIEILPEDPQEIIDAALDQYLDALLADPFTSRKNMTDLRTVLAFFAARADVPIAFSAQCANLVVMFNEAIEARNILAAIYRNAISNDIALEQKENTEHATLFLETEVGNKTIVLRRAVKILFSPPPRPGEAPRDLGTEVLIDRRAMPPSLGG
jgi:hypothetical protein